MTAALRAEVDRLRKSLAGFEHHAAELAVQLEASRGLAERLRREREGEVWLWQGDDGDQVDSLACPVLIEAADLRALLNMDARLDYLFHAGVGEAADRLVLTQDNPHRDLGGWCRQAVRDVLERRTP